jgi:acetyl-CoA carboxylase biotin carboxylase subunit
MSAAGIPVLPGSCGILKTVEEATAYAEEVGFPVILKASAGGGGRGMRIVRQASELESNFTQAQAEAAAAFSCPDVYLEKFIENPRHIEFQVIADQHGAIEILGERECSIQRRHQKLIEEAPSPGVSLALRSATMETLRHAMLEVGYTNAGTVEFLMDENGLLYFIEVNARIQVEHPVTELVTGVDLVKAQIAIAAGHHLSELIPHPITFSGHAIECRINAEHPETFAPSPGRVTGFNLPGGIGVRVDTSAYTDCVIPPYYDSLVAKLIVHGRNRQEAISRMSRALDMFVIEGIHTTIPLHQRIMQQPAFIAGDLSTHFLEHMKNGRHSQHS